MKILMVHKFYYIEGGAERYVFNLTDLLKKNGNDIVPFAMDHPKNFKSDFSQYFVSYFNPDQIRNGKNIFETVKKARQVIFNKEAQEKLEKLIQDTQPDVAHVHSVYHHLSPSVLSVLKKYKLPVVLTLHDYKLVCPNYIFMDGRRKICEACKGRYYWNAVIRKCFRDSYSASLLVSIESTYNNILKCYKNNIDVLVSPSSFLGAKISKYGFDRIQMIIQPYTLAVTEYEPYWGKSDYFVFLGRLTHEKGVHFLLDAMKGINGADLYILGTGPLETELRQRARIERLKNVRFLGYKSGDELKKIISHSLFTVITSEWHDNSPLVIYESQSLGKAVIGSNMGGIPELIDNDIDGYTYTRGDLKGFVQNVQYLISNPDLAIEMGKRAREKAERVYAPDPHYEKIKEIYRLAMSKNQT